MRNKSNHIAGFTFVESLIAFSIVGIFLALTWATVQFMIVRSNDQIVRTRGHFLAMEGVEILKQVRQTAVNRNRETGFGEAIGNKNGNYGLVQVGDEFKLQPNDIERISFETFPYQDYCRQLQIEGDKELKKIQAHVWWGDENCQEPNEEKQIRYSTYLGDLKK